MLIYQHSFSFQVNSRNQKQDLLNQKLLEELDKKNVFDIEDYIKRKGKVKLNRNTVITRL